MIIIPPPKEYRRPRPRASKKKAPPPPITGNRILLVVPGGPAGDDAMIAYVNGTVVGIDDSDNRFQVLVGGDWAPAIGANLDTPGQVLFLFGGDVRAATQWRVPDPGLWHFADAQPMEEPFEGSIS